MKISIKCSLENIVTNLDGSISYYFKQEQQKDVNIYKVADEIKKCQEGAKNCLRVDIDKYREQRSLDANTYFHVLVHKLAEYHNIGNDEMKIKMNLEYGTPAVDKKGNIVMVKIPADVNISDFYDYAKWYAEKKEKNQICNYYIFYKQTHTLNTQEMSRLIEGVISECKQVGIETKTPEQIREMLSLWESQK